MAEVTIYGASDDLIELDGDIYEEFTASDGEPNLIAFSDGTLLEVTYTDAGIWRINALSTCAGTRLAKDEATADEGNREDGKPAYTDVVTLNGFIVWAVFGNAWKMARQSVDA